jgi:cell division protein FtsI (penicillin-binding protein 3)
VKPNIRQSLSHWRFYAVVGILCCLLVLLVSRVFSLQIFDYEFLQGEGAMRSVRTAEIPAYRGVITDRRGEPLAVSTPVVSIWANPKVLRNSDRLEELAQALGMELTGLQDKLSRYKNKQFMYLQRHQVPEVARAVLEKKIAGV